MDSAKFPRARSAVATKSKQKGGKQHPHERLKNHADCANGNSRGEAIVIRCVCVGIVTTLPDLAISTVLLALEQVCCLLGHFIFFNWGPPSPHKEWDTRKKRDPFPRCVISLGVGTQVRGWEISGILRWFRGKASDTGNSAMRQARRAPYAVMNYPQAADHWRNRTSLKTRAGYVFFPLQMMNGMRVRPQTRTRTRTSTSSRKALEHNAGSRTQHGEAKEGMGRAGLGLVEMKQSKTFWLLLLLVRQWSHVAIRIDAKSLNSDVTCKSRPKRWQRRVSVWLCISKWPS